MENNEKTTVTVWLKNGTAIVERVCFNGEAEQDPVAIKNGFPTICCLMGRKKKMRL